MMKIGAIIVTFNPDIDNLSGLISRLLLQNIKIVIVDNGSKSFNLVTNNYELIRLNENKGIASAQNIGIQYLLSEEVDYIIFFDQDSEIDNKFIGNLFNEFLYIKNNIDSKILAIGPRLYNENNDYFYKITNVNFWGFRKHLDVSNISQSVEATIIISSGSLVSVKDLLKVGFMRDNLFIDYVDIEWCFRAKGMGFHCYVAHNVIIKHRIGDYDLNINKSPRSVHSAFRKYFQMRNAILLLNISSVPKLFALKEILGHILFSLRLIYLIKKSRRQYSIALLKGIRDGLRGIFL